MKALRVVADQVARLVLIIGPACILPRPFDLTCAPLLLAALWFTTSSLGALNFLVLQWFGVRLAVTFATRKHDLGDRCAVFRTERSWSILRWIWPLTGWWSDFRRFGDRRREIAHLERQGVLWNMPRRTGEPIELFRARVSTRMRLMVSKGTRDDIANALMIWPFCDHVEIDDARGAAWVTMTWFGKRALCEQMICEVAREAFAAGVTWTIHVRRWRWRWLRAVHYPWDRMTLRGGSS